MGVTMVWPLEVVVVWPFDIVVVVNPFEVCYELVFVARLSGVAALPRTVTGVWLAAG
jgi:hypothetical protein